MLPNRTGLPARRERNDDGQLALLVVGFLLITALLVTVVVNASRVFLVHRSLSAAADGAALAAADALNEAAFYTDPNPQDLPLSSAAASEAAAAYVATADLPARFEGFSAGTSVAPDGVTVTVTCAAVVRLPFLNAASDGYAGGVPIRVTSSARSPLRP